MLARLRDRGDGRGNGFTLEVPNLSADSTWAGLARTAGITAVTPHIESVMSAS